MREVTFKGKKYPVRGFHELRGADWLHTTLNIENGLDDGRTMVAAIASNLAVFVPSAAKKIRGWSTGDIMELAMLVFPEIDASLVEGVTVIKRNTEASQRMCDAIDELVKQYSGSPGGSR